MVFNSFEFAVFFAIVFAIYAFLRGRSLRIWLSVMSYVFYGWANPWYVTLLLSSTVLDFTIGKKLEKTDAVRRRKQLLTLSIIGNIGLLAVFKYSGFAIRTLNDMFGALGTGVSLTEPNITLPVGISFYTFQTLSYTIDVYRGRVKATHDFTTFSLYVAFFPQLVAGPIERATHLLDQLREKHEWRIENTLAGGTRILWGLMKKVVFADYLGVFVKTAYSDLGAASNLEFIVATYAFAFQIYLDFSAYSDIAIGLARLMGIDIRENFRWPYLARNISEFWRRWHISLSTWLRDYLYIPLGGSKKGASRTAVNLTIVMFLGGLWHGADVKFIVWGLWLGVALAVYHTYAKLRHEQPPAEQPITWKDVPGILVTFHIVWISWVFFRADSTLDGARALLRMVSSPLDGPILKAMTFEDMRLVLILLAVTFTAHIVRGLEMTAPLLRVRRPVLVGTLWGLLVVFIVLFHAPTGERFIYFRF